MTVLSKFVEGGSMKKYLLRRLEQGKFHWAKVHQGESMAISPEQLQALIQGLPWQRIGLQQVVTML
jgi:hypothetical protein